MRRMALVLVALFVLGFPALSAQAAERRADVVLYNGKVFTADSARPWVQAVAIRGSRIVAVGNNGPVRALAGAGTRSYDLGGRVVIPGINDSHAHLAVGFPRLTLPPINIPGSGPTLAQALDQVSQAVAVATPGEVILVLVGETLLLDPLATRQAIDPIAPNNPVILLTWSSHSAVINTAAMVLGGIGERQADPFGGAYNRFPGTDVVNGVIHEYAVFRLVRAVRGIVPDEIMRAQFEALTGLLAQVGVTTAQEMTIGFTKERSERVLDGADVKIRLRLMCVPLSPGESCQPTRFAPLSTGRITSSGIKWILDGTPVERSAALREPYVDVPTLGRFNATPPQLHQIVRRSLLGVPLRDQLIAHNVGDRALDNFLGELDHQAPDFIWQLLRPRIEHGNLIQPEHIAQARRKGVVVVQNPIFLTLDFSSIGPERAAEAQPYKTLLTSGVHLAFGSDSGQVNPFVDLMFAVTHPARPDEALTMEQAVTAYTRGSAYAEFQDWQKGSLRRGYLADLAVLSQDIFTVPPPALPTTTSLLTLVGGEVVWDAGVIAPQP